MSAGGMIGERPERLSAETFVPATGLLAAGATQNFEITSDAKGARLPNTFEITGINVTPLNAAHDTPVSTIWRVRFFRRSTRNIWELLYEIDYQFAATNEPELDNTYWSYANEDEENQIIAQITVQVGATAAAFAVSIAFR